MDGRVGIGAPRADERELPRGVLGEAPDRAGGAAEASEDGSGDGAARPEAPNQLPRRRIERVARRPEELRGLERAADVVPHPGHHLLGRPEERDRQEV